MIAFLTYQLDLFTNLLSRMKHYKFVLVFATLLQHYAVGVDITVDFNRAPDLADFAHKVQSTLKQWFPNISQFLASPGYKPLEKFRIVFDPNYGGVAAAALDFIVGSVKYYRGHQDDVGSMIHEMCHLIQAYPNAQSSWLTEGIADYVRYYYFEPNKKLSKPGPKNKYTDGYWITAYFLNYIVTKVRQDMVYFANKDCREGNYTDTLWPRLTGKTLEQLWADMIAHG